MTHRLWLLLLLAGSGLTVSELATGADMTQAASAAAEPVAPPSEPVTVAEPAAAADAADLSASSAAESTEPAPTAAELSASTPADSAAPDAPAPGDSDAENPVVGADIGAGTDTKTGTDTDTDTKTTDDAAPTAAAVRIADPYIDLHTGPGRGYPKFQVVERGGLIELLGRRTDWFLVRTPRGHEGWVHRDQLLRTLTPDGEAVQVSEASQQDFSAREWEFGVMSGEFEKAQVISVYGAWGFTENLSLELTLGHVMGNFSNAKYATLHLTHQPFPEWWISPYFQLGTGYIQTDPAATIIQTEDRQEQLSHVGIGARTYLTRRFVFRVEYNNYVVLTDRNDNEKVEEWKAGFSLFF